VVIIRDSDKANMDTCARWDRSPHESRARRYSGPTNSLADRRLIPGEGIETRVCDPLMFRNIGNVGRVLFAVCLTDPVQH
jgi:hypothetical protein